MKGRVTKKNGNYYVVLELIDDDGKRKQKWISPCKELNIPRPEKKRDEKKLAESYLVDKLRELNQGTYFESSKTTVSEYMDIWLKNYCKPNLRLASYRLKSSLIENHIKPGIGDIKLADLRPGHVQQFLTDRSSVLSAGSLTVLYRQIKQSLSHAVKWEYIPRNVCDAVVPPKLEKHQVAVWTRAEAKIFLTATKGMRLHVFFLLALTTGMRRGELLGLRWQDIDFITGQIKICQSLVDGKGGYRIERTKTDAGYRTVDVSAAVLKELKRHKKAQQKEIKVLMLPMNHYVFLTEKGKPYTPCIPWNILQELCEKFKLPTISIHGLRHTHATLLLEDGVNPKALAERLGHANISITLQTYSHVMPRIAKEAANKTDDLIAR